MKKLTFILLSVILIISLTACESSIQNEEPHITSTEIQTAAAPAESEDNSAENTESGTESVNAADSGSSNILIAYFSVTETDGVDTVASASRVAMNGEVLGNTQYIAEIIQNTLGGDLFEIETVQEYPGSHSPLLDFAYNEKRDNARPELASHIENFDSYDTVFIGYPNWNADLPMPIYTFFDEYDFSGKTIIPFVTHGGSGFSNTVRTIKDLEPNAVVTENNLSVSRNNVPNAEEEARKWAESLFAE